MNSTSALPGRILAAWAIAIAVSAGIMGPASAQSRVHPDGRIVVQEHGMRAGLSLPVAGQPVSAMPNVSQAQVAFYYQADVPVTELQAFDMVVLDPRRIAAPPQPERTPRTLWLARLDLGQGLARMQPDRPAAGDASSFESFVHEVVRPLWEQGYRGFLLDDHVPAGAVTTGRDDAMLGSLLDTLAAQFPQAVVLLRNHADVAVAHAHHLSGLVVDALYHRTGGYGGLLANVPQAERDGVLQHLAALRATTSLPVIALDYCAGSDKPCRRKVAARLDQDGLVPYVTSPGIDVVGIGRLEVMPRKILMVQAYGRDTMLDETKGVTALSMPLNYLGYDIEYVNLSTDPLPGPIGTDRYAGVVVALGGSAPNAALWRQWLVGRIREGLRVAVFGHFGFSLDEAGARALGLVPVAGGLSGISELRIAQQSPIMGFETTLAPDVRRIAPVQTPTGGQSLLRLAAGDRMYDAAALTDWGGYVLSPFDVVSLDRLAQSRWGVDPMAFFRQALALPDMPVPDVTSENGRRLMFSHVDGDAFVSLAEFGSGAGRYSAEILYDRILKRYPVPMSVSIVEGEIGPSGAWPQLSPHLEDVARRIFALPHVEIATHTYSHPFFWSRVDAVTGHPVQPMYIPPKERNEAFSLDIPGYTFDLDREIGGSADYINRRLAPAGKQVRVVHWTGDAMAPLSALRAADRAGLFNINGGMTIISQNKNSLTNVAPYGVARGPNPADYQVYAAVMNENVYTNDWTGPFYGYRDVLETFAMTDHPLRLKALNIYYHFYSATKTAPLEALETIFKTVLTQPVFPVYTTDYIQRVLDWRNVVVAREGERWKVRSGDHLRQLRWSGAGVPDLGNARGVAGYGQGPGGLYVHMGSDEAVFGMGNVAPRPLPHIREASGFVRDVQRDGLGLSFRIGGYYKPFVELDGAAGCAIEVDGQPARARSSGPSRLSGQASQPVAYHSVKVRCE